MTTAIDLFAPNLVATKTVADLSGGNSLPGDTLEYTVNGRANTGQDAAGNVILTDPIPPTRFTSPGRRASAPGPTPGILTDAAGDDQAFFDAAHNQVVFDLGAGATALLGGTLGIGRDCDPLPRPGRSRRAREHRCHQPGDDQLPGRHNGLPLHLAEHGARLHCIAELRGRCRPGQDRVQPRSERRRQRHLHRDGHRQRPWTGHGQRDYIRPATTRPPSWSSAITSQGAYDGGTGLWTVGSLANGGVATLTIIATVASPNPQTNTATISHRLRRSERVQQPGQPATETPQLADLAIAKSVSNPTPNVGDTSHLR